MYINRHMYPILSIIVGKKNLPNSFLVQSTLRKFILHCQLATRFQMDLSSYSVVSVQASMNFLRRSRHESKSDRRMTPCYPFIKMNKLNLKEAR